MEKTNMGEQNKSEQTIFYLWPILTFTGLMIYHAIVLGLESFTLTSVFINLVYLLMIFTLSKHKESVFLRRVQIGIALLIIIYFWADTCVYLSIHQRITVNYVISNYQDVNVFIYFITPKLIVFTALVIIIPILLRNRTISGAFFGRFVIFSDARIFFLCLILLYFLEKHSDIQMGSNVIDLSNTWVAATSVESQTYDLIKQNYPELIERINNYFSGNQWRQDNANQSTNKPNIIIVVSESLSMVDSHYAGGLFNRLPLIDKIQEEGLVFKHAVANGKITAHGLAASFLGIQTTNVGGFESMMTQFPPQKFPGNNLIAYAKQHGYRTVIISVGQPKNFESFDSWFHSIGFDDIYLSDSEIFAGAPRFTWNAPSDKAMYQVAEQMIPTLKQPYLLVIETVSLHQLYILPDEKYHISDIPLLNLINYVDNTTYNFYEAIKKMGFLANGYFILYGDHRRFEPLENEEQKNGGYPVWHERIVDTIVGKNIPAHSATNMPFSLVDMNNLMHFIIKGQPINDQTLHEASLSHQLGIDTPLSISIVDDTHGTYLIRSEKYPPLYISIFGKIPFDKIPYPDYLKAIIYLIQNNQYNEERRDNK